MAEHLRSNLAAVRRRIAAAAERSGREASSVKLVAVSKTHSADVLRSAIAAGAGVLGENKVQEAERKIAEIGRDGAEWHLIGHLQSNKARRAVQLFDVIQSVDSAELARRLERVCIEENRPSLAVYVQVDLAGEQAKSGVSEKDLPALVEALTACTRLKFEGLMVVPPFFDNAERARPYFARLRELRDGLLAKHAFSKDRGELSMGMSQDFEVAVEEGATVVRVGTAIFGIRT